MDTTTTATFCEDSGRVYGRSVIGFGVIVVGIGVISLLGPLLWPGTDIVVSGLVGILIVLASVPIFRWGRRLSHIALIARADGVEIRNPRHDHILSWDEIRGFEPGYVSGVSAARGDIPVVVLVRRNGHRIVVQALRVDYGPFKNKQAEARVQRLCRSIESHRPEPTAPAEVPMSRGSAHGAGRA
jgi:hypothetical protein